jgi:hypothetical protein
MYVVISVYNSTTLDRLTANCGMVGNLFILQPHAAGFNWVEPTSWQLLILFWLEANNILLRTSDFFLLSSFFPIPLEQIMALRIPKHAQTVFKSRRELGASSNESLTCTQQQKHKLVNCDTANAATINITQNVYLKLSARPEVARIRSSMQLDMSISVSW